MTTALEVADWFLGSIDRESGDSITHLKLQKLVYYAQAWALALQGRPLFDEELKAWAHGPVAESVYRANEGSSWNALPAPKHLPEFEPEIAELLGEILASYGGFSAKQLEQMTHAELPWKEARGNLPPEARSNNVIKKETMRSFYAELYAAASDGGKEES
ncbi:type II toxin-antitoxin system antitoxin SocA domain-containing protein [Mesorhizobium sp. WSM3862]|uniref:Panacea domain-containing protein n=1 Tax=Mesorhizobium sp. WSM3862 TaxID=632858 RepID=UPI000BAF6FE1|nr:type II toxin-antitoxin system antitoxin SocA domain-containing protein [Mesorhizobium sp. WSM3862]PBB94991.1 hypothetical protein CK224_29275 [Mesorhizobium sp. WSM3862]